MKIIKITAFLLSVMILMGVAGCGKKNSSSDMGLATKPTAIPGAVEKPEFVAASKDGSRSDKPLGFQFEKPAPGEEIAVFTIKDFGVIRIRLFPQEAPIAVANFKSLIKGKYYDGVTFHRVMKDFMVQGGDPSGTGSGGQSAWGEDFEDEFNKNLLNFNGSVSMANSGANTNGSQFFINTSTGFSLDNDSYSNYIKQYDDDKNEFKEMYSAQYENWEELFYANIGIKMDEKTWGMYKQKGGNSHLDGAFKPKGAGHTVFGQAFEEDLKVAVEMSKLQIDKNGTPSKQIIIEKAEIVKYQQ